MFITLHRESLNMNLKIGLNGVYLMLLLNKNNLN